MDWMVQVSGIWFPTGLGGFFNPHSVRRLPLESAECPIWCVRRVSFPGVKWPGCEADFSPPFISKVKNMWIYTSTLPFMLIGVSLKHRNYFTFIFALICLQGVIHLGQLCHVSVCTEIVTFQRILMCGLFNDVNFIFTGITIEWGNWAVSVCQHENIILYHLYY
jgi:hypothetical protein